jgi:hypothetical protein
MHGTKVFAIYIVRIASFLIVGCISEEDLHDHSGACIYTAETHNVCRDNVASESACAELSTTDYWEFHPNTTCAQIFD